MSNNNANSSTIQSAQFNDAEAAAIPDDVLAQMPPQFREMVREEKAAAAATAKPAEQDARNNTGDDPDANAKGNPEQPEQPEQETEKVDGNDQDNRDPHAEPEANDDPEKKKPEDAMGEVEFLREALRRSEAARKTISGKYNAETKRLREELAAAKSTANNGNNPEQTSQEKPAAQQNALPLSEADLQRLAERGWDADDVKTLAEVISKSVSAKNGNSLKTEEQPPKSGTEANPDAAINATLEAQTGMTLDAVAKIPDLTAHMLMLSDSQTGKSAKELYDEAIDSGDTTEAAAILSDVVKALRAQGRIPSSGNSAKNSRPVAPATAKNGAVALPPAKPDAATAQREYERVYEQFKRDPQKHFSALEKAQKKLEEALG